MTSRIDIIGQNGNEGIHYLGKADFPCWIDAYTRAPCSYNLIPESERLYFSSLKEYLNYYANVDYKEDVVNHLKHYTSHPSGIECIQITEHMGFNLGNALKYIWRCDLKKDAIEDLKKAIWYIERELAKREKNGTSN